ncbi:hypothetical protein KSF_072090 [Reticulibacter mediterranei]|uniref:Uncharacterized protein n=1 Tax=Reticulibacter mediterranei TaxID=2778369 RepID=A0A8J3IXP1_9CHLR|nr:hypothetical protein KSF_072090 [Reticulibacter mediterranei]
MPHTSPQRCPNQISGLLFVTLTAACAVYYDLDSLYRSCDTLARSQITTYKLDPVSGLVLAPAEYAYAVACGL